MTHTLLTLKEIKEHISDYYKKLFGSEESQGILLDVDLSIIDLAG